MVISPMLPSTSGDRELVWYTEEPATQRPLLKSSELRASLATHVRVSVFPTHRLAPHLEGVKPGSY